MAFEFGYSVFSSSDSHLGIVFVEIDWFVLLALVLLG